MFKLRDSEFEVKSATFFGIFLDKEMNKRAGNKIDASSFSWHLDVVMSDGRLEDRTETEGGTGISTYKIVAPYLYHNNGFSLPVRSWKDIEGLTRTWDAGNIEETEEAGTLYVFDHEAVTSGSIQILNRTDHGFFMRWSGTADMFQAEPYGEDVPFLFEGEVLFKGVSASCDGICTLEELKPAMDKFINSDEYECISEDCQVNESGRSHRWRFAAKGFHN